MSKTCKLSYFILMPSTTVNSETTLSTQSIAPTKTKPQTIFVVLLHDGRFVVGQSHNSPKRIANLNGGMHPAVPKSLCVRRIIGIKEVNEQRTLPSVVAKLCRDFGEDKVICI